MSVYRSEYKGNPYVIIPFILMYLLVILHFTSMVQYVYVTANMHFSDAYARNNYENISYNSSIPQKIFNLDYERQTTISYFDIFTNCNGNHGAENNRSLLIQVHSGCENKASRDAIRNTWGAKTNYRNPIRVVFLIGLCKLSKDNEKVHKEVKLHRDVIRLDIQEDYTNLSLKTVAGIEWFHKRFCVGDYIFKSDDDVYIDLEYLYNFLGNISSSDNAIHGHVHTHARVQRGGIWAVSKHLHPADHYPDYCAGNGYLLSRCAAEKLLTCHRSRGQPALPIEDVYLSGVLRTCARLPLSHDPRFPTWSTTPSRRTLRALLRGSLFALHGVDYARMYKIHDMVMDCRNCSEDEILFSTYFTKIRNAKPQL